MADADTAQAPTDAATPATETTPPASAAAASTSATPDAASVAAQAAALAAADKTPAAPVVPEKYEFKLPKDVTETNPLVERTVAIARELGLGNDAAQKLLDTNMKAATDAQAQQAALVQSWQPGGENFKARDAQWRKEAMADPDLGPTPEAFAASLERAQQALVKYGPELKGYLEQTGLGSHPAAIKFLARIGSAMSEGGLVVGATGKAASGPKSTEELFYGATA